MNVLTIKSSVLILIIGFVMAGCTQATKPGDDMADIGDDVSDATSGTTIGTIGVGDDLAGTALAGMKISYEKNAIDDPENVLSIKTIYFAYDSSEISEEDIEVIKHHGKYLALHSDMTLRLEGHTDERGTREYNVALADRRAQAIKKMLLYQGASASQITIISYGEEKPAAMGHDEDSWRLNRRVELVYEL
jgi:peptidoglycan-associated lipoprotein